VRARESLARRSGTLPRMVSQAVAGACRCGAVRLEIELPTLFCAHCHCTICRRQHGAAFVTWVGVATERFRLRAGQECIVWHASSEHGRRSFCGRCGTALLFETSRHPGRVDVPLALLEGPIDRPPQLHVFFDDRVPWVRVDDALPKLGGVSGLEPLEG